MDKYPILLVDDETIIRLDMAADLNEAGYQVKTAASGEQALDFLQKEHYAVMVTDLLMQGMNGITLLQKAREIDPHIGVVILTGFGDMNSAIEALRNGADDYLTKPCNPEELRWRIAKLLEQYELKRKIRLYEDILPICCFCRKIRDDSGKEPGTGEWMKLEDYLLKKAGVRSSHAICKVCMKKHYPV